MMTVREMIADLEGMDGDTLIVLAQDAEGNRYSPLDAMAKGAYRAETKCSGDFGPAELTKKMKAAGFGPEDIVDGKPAVCLFPTN